MSRAHIHHTATHDTFPFLFVTKSFGPEVKFDEKGRNHPGISVWPVRSVWSADLVFDNKIVRHEFYSAHTKIYRGTTFQKVRYDWTIVDHACSWHVEPLGTFRLSSDIDLNWIASKLIAVKWDHQTWSYERWTYAYPLYKVKSLAISTKTFVLPKKSINTIKSVSKPALKKSTRTF